jgi:hypothetical protein
LSQSLSAITFTTVYSPFAMLVRIGVIQLSHVIALLMTNIEITIVRLPLLYIFLHMGITLYLNILRTTFDLTKLPKTYAWWRQSLEASNCLQCSWHGIWNKFWIKMTNFSNRWTFWKMMFSCLLLQTWIQKQELVMA